MIAQNVIDNILQRTNLAEIASEYIQLKKNGADYVACCPFHEEKTASFRIYTNSNRWRCYGACQEGGNVFSFLMKIKGITFPEAAKELANKYSIQITEEEEGVDEIKKRLYKEALMNLNERVTKIFNANIYEKNEEAKKAKSYVINRFGEEAIQRHDIGYAPGGWDFLVNWATEKKENFEHLEYLGLIRKTKDGQKYFDTYRDRIIFPIRNRTNQVIGFTARDISDKEDAPKYINSCESEIYHKSYSMYGMDVAYKSIAKKNICYLVEGAADVIKMNSAGITNVVAPLGGNWTEAQFKQIKKITDTICFVPDNDVQKNPEVLAPGFAFTVKNGELALKIGLNVNVREIPKAEGNRKQDPGDYITNIAHFNQLEEKDFILWTAEKIFLKNENPQKKQEHFIFISKLMALIGDEMKTNFLLPSLVKFVKGKQFWENSINTIKRETNTTKEIIKKGVDLRIYGFYEDNGSYYSLSEKGDVQITNFTMEPLFHIKDADKPKRIFLIKNKKSGNSIVEMDIEELVSISLFRKKLEGIGPLLFMGNDRDLMKMKGYLYDRTESAVTIKSMGWNEQGFYAFSNGVWYDGSFIKCDEFGIVRIIEKGNFFIPCASNLNLYDEESFEHEKKFVHLGLSNISMKEYTKKFIDVFGKNGQVGLMYWIASLFRDIVTKSTRSFPILNLFGPRGSGKTELGSALMNFFTIDNKPPNVRNSTNAALNEAVAFASNAMVHVDEYKNDLDPKKIEFLKGMYDGVGRTKMGGSDYKDIKMTRVKSGVILSGQEMPTADIALFHRCIFLTFPKSDFTTVEMARFSKLREIQKMGLTHLTLQILKYRKHFNAVFLECYNEIIQRINELTKNKPMETRIVENWTKILAAYKCLENLNIFPFSFKEAFDTVIEGLKNQNKECGTNNEIANFWNMISFLNANGDIYMNGDYKIEYKSAFKTDKIEAQYQDPKKILLLNKSRIFTLYKITCKKSGDKELPENTIKFYLENSDAYMGQKKSRFKKIINGVPAIVQGTGTQFQETILTAYCFDFDILKRNYDINFEIK